MKRYEIFKKFNQFVQKKDLRPMDEICKSGESDFALQAQQLFLKEYMKEYPKWKSLLLYHEIGSGKTCTAITMAEEYLKTYPNNKIKVILPARLRTNFIDELISPCGMEIYLSKEDFNNFMSSSTKASVKKQIKTRFTTAINQRYEIISFEKFKNLALKPKNNQKNKTFKTKDDLKKTAFEILKPQKLKPNDLIKWVKDFTKDSMIIIDEVHNLLSDKYDVKKSKPILETGKITHNVKGMNTILFKLLTMHADESSKMIFLTATPIFDNIMQMRELVTAMSPNAEIKKNAKISDVIDHLRGKVSYFPGTSVNAYPTVKYNDHEIPFSKTQDEDTYDILLEGGEEGDELKESFMAKQRQVSLACLPKNKTVTIDAVLENMQEYCPKIKKMIEVINSEPGKHVVYSNFIKSGLKIVEAALKKDGWVNLFTVVKDENKWNEKKDKVYAFWDGSVKDKDKQTIKGIVNSRNNIYGEKIRVILGSPSVKEGVSFKHIQHIHLLDPVWNQSAKTQVEGRAIRYCSHVDITNDHKPLKREVTVDIYKSTPKRGGMVEKTCDQTIYDEIIPNKTKLVSAGERALKKVAIDHYLFRNMYSVVKLKTPESPPNSSKSNIDIDEEDNVALNMKNKQTKKTTTCPKKRRPDKEGVCPPEHYKKKNNQGFDCCYKVGKKKNLDTTKTKNPGSCPKTRLPVDGKCNEGFVIKKNKKGEDCCYKKYTKKE